MAFLANAVVSGFALRRPVIPFVFLLASLAMGLWISLGGGFSSPFTGRITAIVVLTCPFLFPGMVFSTLLTSSRDVSSVMSLNLIGALVGGMLEYNSMYFGFQFLYVVAMILYVAAFLSSPRSWVSGIVTNQRSDGALEIG